jgi:hypothetical protein
MVNKMNERIQELWDQCKTTNWSIDNPEYDHEKFAESIVSECVMLCDKVYEQNDNVKIQAGATFCREDIKKHFGVEK